MLNYCFTTKHLLWELKQTGEAFFTEHSLQHHLIVALTVILIGKINLGGENRATSKQANISFPWFEPQKQGEKKACAFLLYAKSPGKGILTRAQNVYTSTMQNVFELLSAAQ